MRLLLDTHVFLWFIKDDPKLPADFRAAIRDPANEVYLSVASVWEAIVKHAVGKLALPQPPAMYLSRERELHAISSLPIEEEAMAHLAMLPLLHRDPFDRVIIAQANYHDLTLMTVDPAVKAYPVRLFTP